MNLFLKFGLLSEMNPSEAKSIIEALLFSSSKPLSVKQVSQVLEDLSQGAIRSLILELQKEYDLSKRSFQVIEVANGFQVCTRPEYAPWLEKFHRKEMAARISPAALETLAIIAYKQPATKSEVDQIRGVNSDSAINSLIQKKLVSISGRRPGAGRPLLYSTTPEFLRQFGLKNLSDLPSIEEIEQMLKIE